MGTAELCSVSAPVLLCDLGGETQAPAQEVPGGPGEHRASRASTASQRLAGWSQVSSVRPLAGSVL